ncbi:MAG: PilN domain-containing protein [Betaproteobacteria bacterium]|nr:PilN domain-containing protein [Betaproteobacteria bacterium]
MIRINLLPHREIRRKDQQLKFFSTLGIVVGIGAAIWGVGHFSLNEQIDERKDRNKYLTGEIEKLDKQIDEIKKMREQIASLLARKKVVEALQSNRSEVVHLLDQMVRQLPDGVYLKGIKQSGGKVTISGFTQSQARVSTLMRNLESSPHLENPGLIEIKAVQQGGQRINEFTMTVNVSRAKTEEAAKKPAAKPAAKG